MKIVGCFLKLLARKFLRVPDFVEPPQQTQKTSRTLRGDALLLQFAIFNGSLVESPLVLKNICQILVIFELTRFGFEFGRISSLGHQTVKNSVPVQLIVRLKL